MIRQRRGRRFERAGPRKSFFIQCQDLRGGRLSCRSKRAIHGTAPSKTTASLQFTRLMTRRSEPLGRMVVNREHLPPAPEDPARAQPAMPPAGALDFSRKLAPSEREVLTWDPLVLRPTVEDFNAELEAWHLKETGERLRVPVFSKKELNLAQLWSVVQELGGSEKVCVEKRWAGIGRRFDPPKNMTNLSYHIKRLYEKHLLGFERAKFKHRAMSVENEQVNACKKRVPGDDYYEFDPVRMEPVPVSSCATLCEPHTSESPASTPNVFPAKGIAFKSSLLEVSDTPVSKGEIVGIIPRDRTHEKRAIEGKLDTTTDVYVKKEPGQFIYESAINPRQKEIMVAEPRGALRCVRKPPAVDPLQTDHGMQNHRNYVNVHTGGHIEEELQPNVSVQVVPLFQVNRWREDGLKQILSADPIEEADQVVRATLQPLNIPGRTPLRKQGTIGDISNEETFRAIVNQMRVAHAQEVASLKNDINMLQKKNVEIEIAQKVSEAVADESRRCFQDLLQRSGIAKVTTGGIWITSQGRNGKRSDRSENDATSKRPRKTPKGLSQHRN